MENSALTLYLEINESNYIFFVSENDEQNNFKIIKELKIPLEGIEHNKFSDSEKSFNIIKDNIYLIEQKLNFTFKEIVLIIDCFNPTFINLTGFKKLNGSQVLRENITYILNILKSCVDEIESKKTVLHIFNSKFYLDNKETENLPIGLFGDFYSHELSFALINTNDQNNLKNIFKKCNLNIKKILIKSYIKGANISADYKNSDTFFYIKINKNNAKIFYFENNSLKFEQTFKFGTDIIIKDISKITYLKIDTIKMILDKIEIYNNVSGEELIEESFFSNIGYRKIKKKLIYEIALARIEEISEVMLFKNINLTHYNKVSKNIFLEIDQKLRFKCLEKIYKKTFSNNERYNVNFIDTLLSESFLNTAHKLVHFGWKKEAIPTIRTKKSLIVRLFEALFS